MFGVSPRMEILQPLWALAPALVQSSTAFFFPHLSWNFPCCNLCLWPLILLLYISETFWLSLLYTLKLGSCREQWEHEGFKTLHLCCYESSVPAHFSRLLRSSEWYPYPPGRYWLLFSNWCCPQTCWGCLPFRLLKDAKQNWSWN